MGKQLLKDYKPLKTDLLWAARLWIDRMCFCWSMVKNYIGTLKRNFHQSNNYMQNVMTSKPSTHSYAALRITLSNYF